MPGPLPDSSSPDSLAPDPLASLRDDGHGRRDWRSELEAAVEAVRAAIPMGALVAGSLVVAVALGALAWLVLRPSSTPAAAPVAVVPTSSALPFAATSVPVSEVVVDVGGAVIGPGVYRLPSSARVDDLVAAAGGLAADADRSRINLAAPVVDGSRVYIPRLGESDPPPLVGADAPSGPGSSSTGTAPSAMVDLNRATSAELEELPGIGPATAAAIIEYRSSHGPFRTVDGLLEVRGVGPAKLEALRAHVRV